MSRRLPTISGPQGFQGAQGSDGPQGPADGAQGFQGFQGSIGIQGSTGSQGPQGFQGLQGVQGVQGPADGAQGYQGFQGFQGFQGASGNGFSGALINSSSASGTKIQNLVAGNNNVTSLTNVVYDTSGSLTGTPNKFTIPAGVSHVQLFASLLTNNQTDQVILKILKNNVDTFTTAIDVQSTGNDAAAAYTPVLAVNPGDVFSLQINTAIARGILSSTSTWFGITIVNGSGPQGAQGAQGAFGGPQGDTGAQGFQGFQGSVGSQGFQGAQGSSGSQGFQGDVGAQGAQGRQGVSGAQGSAGSTGAQGSQGFQGFQGASGAQGSIGSSGAQGAQGAQGFQGLTGSGSQGFQGVAGAQGSQGFQGVAGSQGAGIGETYTGTYSSVYILRRVTTDASSTELTTDGNAPTSSNVIVLSNNSTSIFEATITARRTDVDGENAGYNIKVVLYRNANAASTSIVGGDYKVIIAENTSGWDVNVSANTTDGALRMTVNGAVSSTISWIAYIREIKVVE